MGSDVFSAMTASIVSSRSTFDRGMTERGTHHCTGHVRPTYWCDQSGISKYFDSIEITLNLPKKRCTIVMLPLKSGSPNTSAV